MNERSVSVNGISIYSLINPNLRSFCLSLYVRAGSIFEDLSNNGISHLFEHVVFRNIKKLRSKLVKKLIFVELAGNLCYSNKLSERQILSLRQPAAGKDEK